MSSLIEQLVHDTIEEYERLAAENKKLAEALRAEWAALNRPVDQSVDQLVDQSVDADGWVDWGGGDNPFRDNLDCLVDVRLRNGEYRWNQTGGWLRWSRLKPTDAYYAFDIVAYRIIKEEA